MKKVNVAPGQKFLVINWLELHKGCELLASYIRESGKLYDSILTANRGGLIVAGIVANILDIRKIAHMGISILNDDDPIKTPFVTIHSQLNPATLTENVLFVRDVRPKCTRGMAWLLGQRTVYWVEGSGISFLVDGSIPIYRGGDGRTTYAKLTVPAERIGQRWRAT